MESAQGLDRVQGVVMIFAELGTTDLVVRHGQGERFGIPTLMDQNNDDVVQRFKGEQVVRAEGLLAGSMGDLMLLECLVQIEHPNNLTHQIPRFDRAFMTFSELTYPAI